MATLVNGNGNPAVYAQQDADLYVGVMGTTSCIMSVGSKFAATIETANLISVADGVILTKEGRRIQTDVGEVDEFNIPNGAAGVTRYYIIGYHLYTDGQGSQKCETFVQLMSSATDTIPEAEFRNGATEVYVSLYRVTQVGLTLNDPESLLPDALNIGDINASLTELDDNLTASDNHKFEFMTDGDGNYGYRGADDSFVPFSSLVPLTGENLADALTYKSQFHWTYNGSYVSYYYVPAKTDDVILVFPLKNNGAFRVKTDQCTALNTYKGNELQYTEPFLVKSDTDRGIQFKPNTNPANMPIAIVMNLSNIFTVDSITNFVSNVVNNLTVANGSSSGNNISATSGKYYLICADVHNAVLSLDGCNVLYTQSMPVQGYYDTPYYGGIIYGGIVMVVQATSSTIQLHGNTGDANVKQYAWLELP